MPYADPEKRRAYTAERQSAYRARIHAVINDYKDRPCVDCGIKLPVDCMELDHVRGTKLFTIAQWNKGAIKLEPGQSKIEAIKDEMLKCDVRCPNCHKLRHYEQRKKATASSAPGG